MKYKKVKKEYDGLMILNKKRKYYTFLVGEELYTEKEWNKLIERKAPWNAFYNYECNKNDTYFDFGARFETGYKHSWED